MSPIKQIQDAWNTAGVMADNLAWWDESYRNDGTGRKNTPASKSKPIKPRIERKPGPFDEGYVKPNTTMEPENKATLSEWLNPGPRQETREIPGGGTQDGLKMSGGVSAAFVPEYANSSFNQLLAGVNTSGYQPFSSNQLPTSAASPDAKTTPKTQQILAGIQAGKQTDMSIDGYEGPGYTTIQPDNPQFAEAFGQDLADKYKSAADSKVTGYTKGGRLDQALSDTAGINSYMSKFSSGDQERLANRAFLDTEGSQEGLRAKEAVNRVVYAGGQHHIPGESADSPAIGIDRSQARDISNGKSSAQSLLKAHIDKNKDVSKDTPAESQNPLSDAASAVKSAFAAGAKTDFALNNNQGSPQTGVGPVVPTDRIPKDLSGAAGREYLRKLDAGELFK